MVSDVTDDQHPASAAASVPFRVSHLTFPEMMNCAMEMRHKIETEWQRAVNVHAALIGVMIFFAGQAEPYISARLVVFVFYSFNVLNSYVNLRETYAGLRGVNADLALFPKPHLGGGLFAWVNTHSQKHDTWSRAGILGLVWLLVGYLMIVPLIFGRIPLAH